MTEQPVLITSIVANNDTPKYHLVDFNGYGIGEAEPFFGVAAADTASGEQCPVIVKGIAIIKSGGAITKGNFVKSGDEGTCIDATAAPTFNNYLVGLALDSASGAGELIRVLLK